MSKLFYKLGLEELAEIAPVAEVPTVSEQEVELDVNRIGSDVLSDVAQVDVAEADTTTLEEVKTALESALKGACDHSALVFAKRTLQMVDKRWGFDYPVASMEDSTETLIASMEDGVGQRLKDMGKAMLEMLKKIWAKLKEWGNKLLQLLGLKKKKIDDIEKQAEDVARDIKEVGAPPVALVKEVAKHNGQLHELTHTAASSNHSSLPIPRQEPTRSSTDFVQLERLMYNWRFPNNADEFNKQITMLTAALSFTGCYNSLIRKFMNEFKTRPLNNMDEVSILSNNMAKFFIENNQLKPNTGGMGNIVGAAKKSWVWGEYLPGMHCLHASWETMDNLRLSNALPEFHLGKTTNGNPVSLDDASVIWLSPEDVSKVTRQLNHHISLFKTMSDNVSRDFVKYSKELEEILVHVTNTHQEGSDTTLKLKFIENVLTLYTRYHATYIDKLGRLNTAYIDAMTYYLTQCNHFWKFATDQLRSKTTNPVEKIRLDQQYIDKRVTEIDASHARSNAAMTEFERLLEEARRNH